MAFWAPGFSAQCSCSESWVVKWHRKRQHGYFTAKPWPLPANRTLDILVLWGVEIERGTHAQF